MEDQPLVSKAELRNLSQDKDQIIALSSYLHLFISWPSTFLVAAPAKWENWFKTSRMTNFAARVSSKEGGSTKITHWIHTALASLASLSGFF